MNLFRHQSTYPAVYSACGCVHRTMMLQNEYTECYSCSCCCPNHDVHTEAVMKAGCCPASLCTVVMFVLLSLCQLLLISCCWWKEVHLPLPSGRITTAEEAPPVCMEISFLDLCFQPRGEEIRRMICGDAWIKTYLHWTDSVCHCTSSNSSQTLNVLIFLLWWWWDRWNNMKREIFFSLIVLSGLHS